MKKTILAIALMALMPALAACGKKADLTRPEDQPRLSYPEGATPKKDRKD